MALSLVTAPALEPISVAEARRHVQLNDTAGEPTPTAPTLALLTPAAPGDCDNGNWRVGFTYVTADGETTLGPLSAAAAVVDKTVNGKLRVTNVAIGGSAVTARKAYAVPPAGGAAKFAATIANNEDIAVTLDIAAADLGAEAPAVNTTVDPELTRAIVTARETGEGATGRAYQAQTWKWVLDGFPCAAFIELPKPPLQSVTHVKYRDTDGVQQTWDASNYVVDAPAGPRCARGRISLAHGVSWPATYGQAGDVEIQFVCGYGDASSDVPSRLRSAMLLEIETLYAHRGSVIAGRGTAHAMELPLGVSAIYRDYTSRARGRRQRIG
jgi:uncharacterized phiE125 gp8 family phage protein